MKFKTGDKLILGFIGVGGIPLPLMYALDKLDKYRNQARLRPDEAKRLLQIGTPEIIDERECLAVGADTLTKYRFFRSQQEDFVRLPDDVYIGFEFRDHILTHIFDLNGLEKIANHREPQRFYLSPP